MKFRTILQTFSRSLLLGKVPPDADLEFLRKSILIRFMTLVGGLFLLVFTLHNFFSQETLLAIADSVMCVVLLGAFFLFRTTGQLRLASILALVPTSLFFLFVLARGQAGLATYVWSFVFPLLCFFLLGLKLGFVLSAFHFLGMLGLFLEAPPVESLTQYPGFIQARALTVYALVTLSALVMEVRRKNAFEALFAHRQALDVQILQLEQGTPEKEVLISRLQKSLAEVRTLKSFLPICSYCRKIRDDAGYWSELEHYLAIHTDARVETGLCPDCARRRSP